MSARQLTLAISHRVQPSYANFEVGNNQQLVDSLKELASKDNKFGFVYFYGLSGAGKSHLLYALMDQFEDLSEKGDTAQYISFNDVDLQDPQTRSETLGFLEYLSPSSLICLDDICAVAGDTEAEQALFSIFERCRAAKGKLVVTASEPPESAGFELRDLVSRLSSALVYPLHELQDDARIAALKARAEQLGFSISSEALNYLTSRMPRDNSALFGLIDTIDKASLAEKRRVTIPFLKSLVDELATD